MFMGLRCCVRVDYRFPASELLKDLFFSFSSMMQPGPRDATIQCFIKRDKSNLTYHLFLCLSPGMLSLPPGCIDGITASVLFLCFPFHVIFQLLLISVLALFGCFTGL